ASASALELDVIRRPAAVVPNDVVDAVKSEAGVFSSRNAAKDVPARVDTKIGTEGAASRNGRRFKTRERCASNCPCVIDSVAPKIERSAEVFHRVTAAEINIAANVRDGPASAKVETAAEQGSVIELGLSVKVRR